MTHGSLFSGIGGFDLAAEWMGWENVFHCENNEFCQKILKQHFPNSVGYSDITKTDFNEWRGKIDIVTGGFPCQPYSAAGKRKGKEDDRHLWPEMLRAIREIQPTWIVGENVPGLLNWQRGMVLAEIKADLEAAGFEVFPPVILPACGKNAPHRRDRLWIVAYSSCISKEQREQKVRRVRDGAFRGSNFKATTNTNIGAAGKIRGNDEKVCGLQDEKRGAKDSTIILRGNNIKNVTNTSNTGLQRGEINGSAGEIREDRNKQFAGSLPPDWENFPTQSPLCGGNDGVPNRVDRIKALGNAVVPQVVYEIFKAIQSLNP